MTEVRRGRGAVQASPERRDAVRRGGLLGAALVVLLGFLAAACAPESSAKDAGSDEGAGTVQDTALVVSQDPELAALARELLPDLAERSGLELRSSVRLDRRSREELVRYLETKLDRDLPPDRAESLTASYALLGLVPEDLDLRQILLAVYTEQVAGFYDPDSTALFVMEDQPAENLRSVLVHELVHAVQDQAADLDSLTSPARGNDRQVAAQAAIEGHATIVMLEYLAEQVRGEPVDLSEIPDFTSRVRPALESLRGQYPALSGAPAVIQESLLFPYLEGAGFVQALWQGSDGRPPPFGERLPASTEQVLAPDRLISVPPDLPTRIAFAAAAGETGGPVYENGLGEMEVRVLLEEMAGREPPRGPLGWDGDRYALFRTDDGSPSLLWLSVWDAAAARDRFVDALGRGLDGFPRPATLQAAEVDGRPVAFLRVGEPPEVSVQLTGGVEDGTGGDAGPADGGGGG